MKSDHDERFRVLGVQVSIEPALLVDGEIPDQAAVTQAKPRAYNLEIIGIENGTRMTHRYVLTPSHAQELIDALKDPLDPPPTPLVPRGATKH